MSKRLMKKIALGSSALCLMGSAALADQVILDDLIVDGSLCVGFDCVNGESFGFDTIRMKENNVRIKADDTSVTASFPGNDWQLTFNDSANGGANKFSVDDTTNGRTPFTIEASAPSHSLYVDDGGRIGLGTSTPSVELHVIDGDTPTLRLQQDGSSGFAPQSFDVAANETNFFVRDVSNGSTLPFRIRPGAPTSSIDIQTDGDVHVSRFVGIGTNNPLGDLHIKGDGSSRRMVLLEQTTAESLWLIQNYETTASEGAGNFGINLSGTGVVFKADTNGDVYFPRLANCSNGLVTDAAGKISCAP